MGSHPYIFEVKIRPDRVMMSLSDDKHKYKDSRSVWHDDATSRGFWPFKKPKFNRTKFERLCAQAKQEMINAYFVNCDVFDEIVEPTDGLSRAIRRDNMDES